MTDKNKATENSAVELDESDLDEVEAGFSLSLNKTMDTSLSSEFLKLDYDVDSSIKDLSAVDIDHKMGGKY